MGRPEINRRQFMRAVAGTTAAVGAAAFAGPGLGMANAANGLLVPRGKIGIQLFTIRNLVSSLGFRVVFEELARMGYHYVEFAGYTSPAEPGITPAQIKQLLDDNGLKGIGGHRGLNSFRSNMEEELDIAETLGLPYIGTANEPVSPPNRTIAGYHAAAEEFNGFGAAAAARGIKWYHHNHQNEFRFANDDPSVRLYDILLAETDPHLVYLEMDIYWAFVGQHIAPGFDPADYVKANMRRYPLFHAKDGESRPDLANGYNIVEFGAGDIDFQSFFRDIGAKGPHYALWEQDNAPSTPEERGGAFGAAERSYQALSTLRG
ncbi:sugar phosphate isomerase/epimerase family protein [Phytoactinopolyspora halotolerans]|uniref:Sugar phosphate isomerase/epimerase n=1 Tax=Phytoactinopolyspora halotolerans TaxID=1981512 RepID=A0A6L9SEG5_9ACTN|nr:sugar phosphate isomerase/epimerase [Phytoactinopolyspora halotolerans]NEE03513.1 sugar phosphate isomerase/epimerase [Phytoactinopolyspora halotolerans]